MSFTPEQYRNHPRGALRRAFLRGGYARVAGLMLDDNPYRQVLVSKRARRGSWSEAYSLAWAVGWRDEDRKRDPAEATAIAADEGVRA